MDAAKRYTGEGVDVTFDARRCVHFAECVSRLPEVFDVSRRPWIEPDGASVERVRETVGRCPSGALHAFVHGGAAEAPAVPTEVAPRPDGPTVVRGDLRIATASGEVRDVRAALCACGRTANAPFCDGACPDRHG